MNIYDAAIKKLKSDTKPLLQLEEETGIPYETLRDIRSGRNKNPRLDTAKKIASHYFPRRMAA